MKEELTKIGMNCNIEFWYVPEKTYFDKKSQALVLFRCNIEILSFNAINKEDGILYLLKNTKNLTYYLRTNNKYDWVETYNQSEGKIFYNLDEIVELIYLYKLNDVTLIKIKNINVGEAKIKTIQDKLPNNMNSFFLIIYVSYMVYINGNRQLIKNGLIMTVLVLLKQLQVQEKHLLQNMLYEYI